MVEEEKQSKVEEAETWCYNAMFREKKLEEARHYGTASRATTIICDFY
ncbi:uncharacterized protein G2W53_040581 [Senna tora]|uniref:Uncharacterized protein n=1 Tax=Senna tora TaxID=362788 RepID=A0A834VYP1_9FABA|nr:uncharacterized protein G2W53_040581 [Senna tora]